MTHPVPLTIGLSTAAGNAFTPGEWRDLLARIDGAADAVTLTDGFAADGPQGPDAIILANWLGGQTRQVSIIAGVAVNFTEPFHISTAIATLDYVTGGRAGLLVQPSGPELAKRALDAISHPGGYPQTEAGDLAEDLADAVAAIRLLWDSWQDDAVIRDVERHRFLDPDRLHHVNFRGRHFSISGPSITPRPPQGQPVGAIALSGPGDPARGADIAFLPLGLGAAGNLPVHGDLTLGFAGEAEAPGLWRGEPGRLAAYLAGLHRPGLSGWRLSPEDPRRDLPLLLAELPALRAAGLIAEPGRGTLRARLGLSPAPNRFAA